MFVFLSKFLPLFLYPLGLACMVLVFALIIDRHARLRRWAIFIALFLLVVGGNRYTASALTRSLEWRFLPPEDIPTAEVIVLLGGATAPAEYPRTLAEVNSAGDRVLYTGWLYKQGAAPYILLSGGRIDFLDWKGESTPASEMAELLVLMGVREKSLWLQDRSRNTSEDALFCAEILREREINRILLVTSAKHMPRSVALFEAQGFEVVPLPTDYQVTQNGWEEMLHPTPQALLISLMPTGANLAATTSALHEYIGMLVYSLRGWMEL